MSAIDAPSLCPTKIVSPAFSSRSTSGSTTSASSCMYAGVRACANGVEKPFPYRE